MATLRYTNPVVPGFYPDPSVIRVGEDYYMAASSFEYMPGLPIFHSRNLTDWRQIGHALNRRSQIDLSTRKSSEGIYAPTLRYHQGVFYLITTDVMGIGNFYITSVNPAGPWSDPICIPYGNIDPSLLLDDDGKVYVTVQSGADAESHIIQYEIDITTGQALTEPIAIAHGDGGVWTEGPHLYHIGSHYYLLCACGGTGRDHRTLVYRAEGPYGPFERMTEPMLTHNALPAHPIQNTGHAELVEDTRGDWWAFFLGVRPVVDIEPVADRLEAVEPQAEVPPSYSVLGRETFLAPVRWTTDGWPTADNNAGTVQLHMSVDRQPFSLAEQARPPASAPLAPAKRHSWRDDFGGQRLDFRWAAPRRLCEACISLEARPGWLTLIGNRHTLLDEAPSVFLGTRLRHHQIAVRSRLYFQPQHEGEEAGLAVRLNEHGHFTLGIRRDGEGNMLTVVVSVADQGKRTEWVSVPLAAPDIPSGEGMELRILSDAYHFALSYAVRPGNWVPLATVPAFVISSESNGGFTGALIGMYAVSTVAVDEPVSVAATPAYFQYFSYDGLDYISHISQT
jgi:alpha-N-arabinofuranosidase